jgi:hypothetical protein
LISTTQAANDVATQDKAAKKSIMPDSTDNTPIPITKIPGLAKAVTTKASDPPPKTIISNNKFSEHAFTAQGGRIFKDLIRHNSEKVLSVSTRQVIISGDQLSRGDVDDTTEKQQSYLDNMGYSYAKESDLVLLFAYRGDVTVTAKWFIETFNDLPLSLFESLYIDTNVQGIYGGAVTLVYGLVYVQTFDNLDIGDSTPGGPGFLGDVEDISFVHIFGQTFDGADGATSVDISMGWDPSPTILTLDFAA